MASLLKSRRAWAGFAGVGLLLVVAWYASAYPRGMLMAHLDHALGHHEMKVYGLPEPWEEEYAELLRQRYGVKWNFVAGCVVPEELARYANGYNAVSRRLLIEKHGKDIFAKCSALAEQQWYDHLTRSDLERLQGTWRMVGGDVLAPEKEEWAVAIKGDELILRRRGRQDVTWTIRLDLRRQPAGIDLIAPQDASKTNHATYSLERDQLTICVSRNFNPNTPVERPTRLTTRAKENENLRGVVMTVYRRQQP
jgi:uncharacterized protein (TIGR03067 family)